MERETGIEPATNSLEGCDSTIELLPPAGAHHPLLGDARTLIEIVRKPAPAGQTSAAGSGAAL